MTRSIITTISILILAILPFGCEKKDAPAAAATTTQAAPALPTDVQNVASAATATTATTSAGETSGSTATPSVASSESGGTIVATGELISPVRSELAVKIPGRVGKMYVDEGSRVSRGQPLLAIETDYPRLNLDKANADIARAVSAEKDAQNDLNRKKELIAKESIPQATYDRSQAMFDQARAAKQSAEAQAAIYRQQLADSTLRSPIDGVVAEKRTDVGQRLGDATVAFVVVQTSPLKLRFRVPEKELARVRLGQNVKATVDAYAGDVFQGKVAVVGGVIDPASRSFTVETEFPNRDGKLRPGMFARVELGR
ncbi:MAG TPA: efflux RND transporter periplasmic adaptor subunit [Thermoanaerobaculia bacterium]|jgi:membrane fusion protein (multidrug efflux system)|nr:efflux RND transporter periplasmic adaptor subunit [Thermoanaerobaculia bacterium]